MPPDEERRPGEGAASTTGRVDTADSNKPGALRIPELPDDIDAVGAAIALAQAGAYLLPAERGTKNPGSVVGRSWQTKSSRDPKVIAGWFAGTDHEIAVHCGRSGWLVFDVDHSEKLPAVLHAHLDSAPCQQTRPDEDPDRCHYVFAVPPGRTFGNSTGRLGKGWGEIRGLNGVIVVAPAGDNRRWKRTGVIPVLPGEIAELLDDCSPAEDAATDAQIRAFLKAHRRATHPGLVKGPATQLTARIAAGKSRHEATLSAAVWAMEEAAAGIYTADSARAAIKEVFIGALGCQRTPDDRVVTGRPAQDEWHGILAWAVGQANAKTADELGAIRAKATAGRRNGQTPEPDGASLLAVRGVTAAWLDAQQFAPLEYHVDGLVTEGLGIFVGPPKKGKSFLVANVGLAVAAGDKALGALATTQRPVLYLALEDGHRRLQNRFRRILGGAPKPAGLTVVTKASPGEALAMIAEFLDQHRDAKPLVILDTLGKARAPKRPGDDAYQTDYALGTTLKNIADAAPGSCLLIVHHTRKAEALDFVDSISGTQGIAGSVDFVMVLDRKRHSDDAVLSVTGRDIPEGEYALVADCGILWRLDGGTLTEARHKVDERRETNNLGDRQSGLLEFVNSRVATTAADAADRLGTTPKLASMALRDLYDRGRIARPKRGVYGPRSAEDIEKAGQNVIPFPARSPESPE
ncbi:MAG: AAA family ATPase [Mycobacterium sp.]|uniref:AAA family ATPase n=1 Tax=Mycobacterium sp. TaxID=1785 RepID=UPI003F9434BE